MIFSFEIERQALSCLFKYPHKYLDISEFIESRDFYNNVNKTIFEILRQTINLGEAVDGIIIGTKIKNMNLHFEDDELNIFEYIDSILVIQVSEQSFRTTFAELKKFSTARSIYQAGNELQREVKSNLSLSTQELINLSDKIYSRTINSYVEPTQIQNVFMDLEELIEKKGNNPVDEMGYKTPYESFNRFYGGLRKGDLYAFASRAGQGKSTLLMDIAFKCGNLTNKNIKILYLDTELSTHDMQLRLASSLSDVNFWYLDTGNWRRNPDMVTKVRDSLKIIKQKQYNFYHKQVANITIEQITDIVNRWYYSVVGRGNDALIVYDYIKLTGEKLSQAYQEYHVIGEKVNQLKEIAIKLNVPLLTAIQVNRAGVVRQNAEVDDSEAVISLSDRLIHIASYLGIFRRKTLEEISKEGSDYGSHKLINLKGRLQGRESQGHSDYVRIIEDGKPKYVQNYINFRVNNFHIEDLGSLRDMI